MKYWIVIFLLGVTSVSYAQQIDGLLKKKPLKLSGGIGVNQTLYVSDGVDDRFNPYTYSIVGNVNVSVFGFNLPFSFSYSNQNLGYKTPQPFNIVGVSPKYKNLTLHAGYRNMTFSPYTLAGHSYFGGGVEYKFKKLKVMAMGGRLRRAVELDTANTAVTPTYMRAGGGVKLAYNDKGNELSFITFYAKDKESSIDALPIDLAIRPMENQVYSIGFKKKLLDNVTLSFEGAGSGWTKDHRDTNEVDSKLYQQAYVLPTKANTVFYTAYKTGLNFTLKKGSFGVNFERVAPEYRTLGAYFVNSDFQNLTLNTSRKILKDKVSISANAGFQKDDLKGTKQSKMSRFVGSINSNITFTKKLNMTLGYSNFNSFINIKPVDRSFVENSIYERIDTLNYTQVNQTANAGINWTPVESDNVLHQVGVNANYSRTDNDNAGVEISNSMMNSNLNYSLSWKKTARSLGVNVSGNKNYFETGAATYLGAGVTGSVPALDKKLRISLGANGYSNFEDSRRVGLLYALTNSYSTKIKKKHALSLSLRYSGRKSQEMSEFSYYDLTFNEFTGNLAYNFSF